MGKRKQKKNSVNDNGKRDRMIIARLKMREVPMSYEVPFVFFWWKPPYVVSVYICKFHQLNEKKQKYILYSYIYTQKCMFFDLNLTRFTQRTLKYLQKYFFVDSFH